MSIDGSNIKERNNSKLIIGQSAHQIYMLIYRQTYVYTMRPTKIAKYFPINQIMLAAQNSIIFRIARIKHKV